MEKIIDSYNALMGCAVMILSAILGQFWFLFLLFLLFNIFDWITGWIKASKLKESSSKVGLKGVLKKLGYWILIATAFAISAALINIGCIIDVDLSFVQYLGWFVLASLMVNEARSITENLVQSGYYVPPMLTKGLAVANELINKKGE